MDKLLELDERFPQTGEPTAQLVAWGGPRGGLSIEKKAFVESQSPLYAFLQNVQPEAGVSYILVNALGAYEFYDDNRNGDGFPNAPYKVGELAQCGHPECTKSLDGWISEPETLSHHYTTFEKHGGIYKHHVNKDPSKSLGWINKSVLNPYMHRVELLLKLVNSRDPDISQRIGDGDFPAVSMGCVTAGTRITLGDGRRKKVEDIAIGDEVLSHAGRGRRVFELHRREYRGTLYTVKAEAAPAFDATHEHPFLVAPASQVRVRNAKGVEGWRPDAKLSPVWKLAEELRGGEHYLLQPIDRHVETPAYVTREFARLLGYYLAEGNSLRDKHGKVSGFELSCHRDDTLLRELPELCAALELPEPYIVARAHSEVARSVRVYDRHVATRLALLCGDGACAKQKHLALEVMHWAPEFQRELFGAYANGDGCGNANGSLHVSTSSEALADQWLSLLPRLGVLASRQTLTHKANSLVRIATIEHVVFIGAQWAQSLRDVCDKVKPHLLRARKESRKIIGDYVVVPIRSLTARPYVGPVYNFEVDEDNTYVTEGSVSHNCHVRWDVCTICGHRAPTRAQYCEHASRMLRRVLPDGRKVAVLNPSPKFFDISFVFRPADPTGWMLKKVAEEQSFRYSVDLGEELRRYQERAIEIRSHSKIASSAVDSAYGAQAREIVREWPKMPAALYAMAKSAGVTSTLSTLAASGVVLSAGEVIDLFAKTSGLTPSSTDLDRLVAISPVLTEVVAQYPDLEAKLGAFVALRVDAVKNELIQPLAAWVEKRGGFTDFFRQRAYAPSDAFQAPVGPGAYYRAREPAKTDVLSMTNPYTGETYQTTRGAAMSAHNADVKAQLASTATLGALYGAGIRAAMGPGSGIWAIPAGLAAGYATQRAVRNEFPPYRYSQYHTNQGLPVSGGTEFVKVSAYARPSYADVVHKEAYDMVERAGTSSYDALLAKIAQAGSTRYAQWLAKTPMRDKVAALVHNAEESPTDVHAAPGLNIGRLVENISRLVWAD